MPEQLEPHQKARLTALETTVRDGLRDFRRTGQALSEIRDNEFFRAGYDSFEAYLQDRWGFTPPQAGRLMEAADVAKVLDPLGIQPKNEAQARTFKAAAKIVTELEPEGQRVRRAQAHAQPAKKSIESVFFSSLIHATDSTFTGCTAKTTAIHHAPGSASRASTRHQTTAAAAWRNTFTK